MAKAKKLTLAPFDPSQGRKVRSVKATQVARMVKQRTGKFNPGTDNPQEILQFGWIDPELIYFNYERQRYPEPTHQKKLDKKWNTNVMTCGQARKDSDGNYYVADGQQHITVYINKYPGQPGSIPKFVDTENGRYTLIEQRLGQMCDDPECTMIGHCVIEDEERNSVDAPYEFLFNEMSEYYKTLPIYTKNKNHELCALCLLK